jgi:hypothetical protein
MIIEYWHKGRMTLALDTAHNPTRGRAVFEENQLARIRDKETVQEFLLSCGALCPLDVLTAFARLTAR